MSSQNSAAPQPLCDCLHSTDAAGLDASLYGVPMDWGTSARSGTRLGPRQVRAESTQIRPCNLGTGASPFASLAIADVGDAPVNPYSLPASIEHIRHFVSKNILGHGCIPVGIGGDHNHPAPHSPRHCRKTRASGLNPRGCPFRHQ